MNVLLVEDSKAEALIFSQTLERVIEGPIQIHHKDTLAAAIIALEEMLDDLDIVFLDLKLPDSVEWQETYGAVAPYAEKIPVIVVTGDDDMDIAHAVLKQGAEDYVVKGSRKRHVDMLRETINFAMYRHKLLRDLADRAEKSRQCAAWMAGGYSVEHEE